MFVFSPPSSSSYSSSALFWCLEDQEESGGCFVVGSVVGIRFQTSSLSLERFVVGVGGNASRKTLVLLVVVVASASVLLCSQTIFSADHASSTAIIYRCCR